MSATGENSQWYRKKQQVVHDYRKEIVGFADEIASRGFTLPPGYVSGVANDLEIGAKMKLSELNFELTKEAIDREVRDAEVTYDESYKALMAAWDVDKQNLLDAMQKSIAAAASRKKIELESVRLLALDIAANRTTIVSREATLRSDLESIKQQILEAEQGTDTSERSLLTGKSATITKKLELIPTLEILITAEEDLLTKITDELIPAQEDIVTELAELITKKEGLTVPLQELYSVKKIYGTTLLNNIGLLEEIRKIQKEQATLKGTLVEHGIDLIEAQLEVETSRRANALQGNSNRQTQMNADIEILSESLAKSKEVAAQQISNIDNAASYDRELIDASNLSRKVISDQSILTAKEVNDIRVDSAVETIDTIGDYRREEREDAALIAQSANIRTSLKHIIS